MKDVLVIVEAPGKTEMLKRALRNINIDAQVMATIGHVADNPSPLSPIGLDRSLREVAYKPKAERTGVMERIRQAAIRSDKVFLAMDDDQEGDVIAWDVAQSLSDCSDRLYRARLRALSENELKQAFSDLSQDFRTPAHNGIARRIIDRAIGASFSEFGTIPVVVGRVQSSLLAQIDKTAPVIGEFVVQAKLSTGETFHASIPVTNLADVPKLEAFSRSIAGGNGEVRGEAIEVIEAMSEPWGYEDVIVEASERLGIGIEAAADGLQEAYERGLVSYPRARRNGFSQDAQETALALARHNRCAFDATALPVRGSASGRVPHEAPRPLDEEMVLGRPLTVLDTPEAIAVLVARNMIECGQRAKVKKATIALDGVEAVFSVADRPTMKSWRDPLPTLGFRRYSMETALLRYMASQKLGRPSTIVQHVRKFLERGLVSGGGDHPFALSEKGRRWLDHALASGFDGNTSSAIEAKVDGVVSDPHALARDVLREHGMLDRVLEVIGESPVGNEADNSSEFVM